jgi:phosphohistidine phosphatase SixA
MTDRRTFMLTTLSFVLLARVPAVDAASPSERADLVTALRRGGLVVYFRHGATNRSGIDQVDWPRERQRLLSAKGEAQAKAVGEVFRRHELPVGEVLASPFARCRDFAEIAFGKVEEKMELIGLLSDEDRQAERIEYSLGLLSRPVDSGTNRIIVGHSSNIRESTGVNLPEGGAVIVRSDNAEVFRVLGTLLPDDWVVLAA